MRKNALLTQCAECSSQQFVASLAIWVPKAPIYGSKRSRDLSDLGAFLWSSKGVILILAPLPCELFPDNQRAAVQ